MTRPVSAWVRGGPYMCELLFIKGNAHTLAYTPKVTHPRAGGGESAYFWRDPRVWGPSPFSLSQEHPPPSSPQTRDWASAPSLSGEGTALDFLFKTRTSRLGGGGGDNLFLSNFKNLVLLHSNQTPWARVDGESSLPPPTIPFLPSLAPPKIPLRSRHGARRRYSPGEEHIFSPPSPPPAIGLVCVGRGVCRGANFAFLVYDREKRLALLSGPARRPLRLPRALSPPRRG